jgi:hypothetical protein
MGLGSVELVMDIEAAFGIVISDAVAEEMITPRHTVDYIASSLGTTPVAHCLTQQLFYRLHRRLRSVLAKDVNVHPATAIREISNKREWPQIWSRIRETAGDPNWPERVPWKGWLVEGPETFRDLTVYIAMHLPPPDLSRGEPWTREQIELVVRRVVWQTIGVQGFKLDDQYVRDLGVD